MTVPDSSFYGVVDIDTEEPSRVQRSPRSCRKSVLHYCCNYPHLAEFVVCFAIFAFGKLIPIIFNSWYTWESPVPIQKISTGDVLLELDLTYDLASETVPDWLCALLCVVLPIFIFAIVGSLCGPNGDVHASLCFFFVAVGITWFLTDMIKCYAGFLRPNFYDMCEYSTKTLQCETDSAHHMDESRKSFPSGHAGLAFGSMTVVTLYFLGKVGIQRNVEYEPASLKTKLLYLASFTPMLLAIFIATSRVHDFYHHPADVVAGAVIGLGCALFTHGMWYPSVYSNWSGVPLHMLHKMNPSVEPSIVSSSSDEERGLD